MGGGFLRTDAGLVTGESVDVELADVELVVESCRCCWWVADGDSGSSCRSLPLEREVIRRRGLGAVHRCWFRVSLSSRGFQPSWPSNAKSVIELLRVESASPFVALCRLSSLTSGSPVLVLLSYVVFVATEDDRWLDA